MTTKNRVLTTCLYCLFTPRILGFAPGKHRQDAEQKILLCEGQSNLARLHLMEQYLGQGGEIRKKERRGYPAAPFLFQEYSFMGCKRFHARRERMHDSNQEGLLYSSYPPSSFTTSDILITQIFGELHPRSDRCPYRQLCRYRFILLKMISRSQHCVRRFH